MHPYADQISPGIDIIEILSMASKEKELDWASKRNRAVWLKLLTDITHYISPSFQLISFIQN